MGGEVKICVIGPGIVGMPMAAMLAHARITIGSTDPARVLVIQRDSPTSGWKVDAINSGRSPIGGVEPELDGIVKEAVLGGTLAASHDIRQTADAHVILVCVQTDRDGDAPDYGPLYQALDGLAEALSQGPPREQPPLVIIESTLAPSSMTTVIRERFAAHGLTEGTGVLLGNSPNRVMPGRLVERIRESDKLVAGLDPRTPRLIEQLYSHIVTRGKLLPTSSLTAEIVKTLENAYRDVRIAFTAEIARYCDARDWDFYSVRRQVNERIRQADSANEDPDSVPSGGLLIPTVGVGGHCLPKDGILLWWRRLEAGGDAGKSLILEARRINDESPRKTLELLEQRFGDYRKGKVALLGVAYRPNSEDTRNSPTLALARILDDEGVEFTLHDPYVHPGDQNLERYGMAGRFTRDLDQAVEGAERIIICTAHTEYRDGFARWQRHASLANGILDACHLFPGGELEGLPHAGIGRGHLEPSPAFLNFVERSFHAVETGVANEVAALAEFLNEHYAVDEFSRAEMGDIRRLAGTCITGCSIVEPGSVDDIPSFDGFRSHLTSPRTPSP